MWNASFYRYKNLIGLIGVCGVVLGCAGTLGHETFKAEGFRVVLPQSGSRIVVGGNHLEAVNQAILWLNNHQLLVVNRWVDKGLTTPKTAHGEKTELQPYVLDMAHKVDAKLVVFVHADETQLDRTDPISGGHPPKKMIGVEIQGINVDTGEIAFGAVAWNSKPLVASNRVVPDLTVLALEKSWQEPTAVALHSQSQMTPKIKTEQETPLRTPVPVEPSNPSMVSQSRSVEPAPGSPEKMSVSTEPGSEETPLDPVRTQPDTAEPSTFENSSLGLQIASGALSILYTPLKVVYAGLGGFVGGLVYILTAGNEEAAGSVWDSSLRGNYWVTPDHLQGNEPLRFKGEAVR